MNSTGRFIFVIDCTRTDFYLIDQRSVSISDGNCASKSRSCNEFWSLKLISKTIFLLVIEVNIILLVMVSEVQ